MCASEKRWHREERERRRRKTKGGGEGSFSPPLTRNPKLLFEKKDLFPPSSSYLFYFTALDGTTFLIVLDGVQGETLGGGN